MEFPRLPYNANRNRKLMDYDDAEIKRLYAEGKTVSWLAKKYEVHWTTIKCHVDEEYRQNKVKREIQSHKKWYDSLPKEKKQELWRYANKDFKENARRFPPQMKYLNAINNNNHNKPANFKKRMRRQKEYTAQPEIKAKILQGARTRYADNPQIREYHRIYDKDFKATHKLINGKWIMVDNLKWRILREMVVRPSISVES